MSGSTREMLFICLLLFAIGQRACVESTLNNRPIIGVLAQELIMESDPQLHPRVSYIAASYVKFLEGAGARVVPVMINKTDDYYKNIASYVNGILLPGGGTYFDTPGGYAEAGQKLYELAKKMNEAGDFFPMLGICLGFELLTYLASDNVEHRASCYSYNEALPLEFKRGSFNSRLFGSAPSDIIGILTKENVTANFHRYCLTKQNMTALELNDDWRFMTTNEDSNGLEFISTLEHSRYPIYGLQFHPEKNVYEWRRDKNHPHSAKAVRVSQYFGNFFVNEARKSGHKFPASEEEEYMIYKHPVKYTANYTVFEQCYEFPL